MNRMQERKQQRREYLKRKGKAYSLAAVGATAYLSSIMFVFTFASLTIISG